MKTTISILCATFAGLGPVAYGQSTQPPAADPDWKRVQATNEFWAEGACAADVNKDGKTDLLCGPFWYEGPDFSKRHEIYPAKASFTGADGAKVAGFEGALSEKNAYSDNFLSYTYDFNGDGWPDYLVIGFPGKATVWWENPKGDGEWKPHTVLASTDCESPMFVDITGDKVPELLCMSGGAIGYAKADPSKPNEPWTWVPVGKGPFQRYTHGIGYGDINGDKRIDILEARGWWEQPADPGQAWTFHEALWGNGGAQMYAFDIDGDGLTDVLTSLEAHGYGLAWFQQTKEDGVQGWTLHLITGTPQKAGETAIVFSQIHAIDLVDMNGDGVPDCVTGKRYRAHGPKGDPEPGAPAVLWWFELKRAGGKVSWVPHLIDADSGVGTEVMGTDVNGDGKPDVVVGNKKGLFLHLRK